MLVRCCGLARGIPVRGPASQSLFPEGFNESRFVDMAVQHKVAGSAYAGLKSLGLSMTPANASRLKQTAMKARLIRELIVKGASAIIDAATAHGIPALILKGPASSKELYGNACVREYTDLDILVNLPDIGPTLPFMAALGYTPKDYREDSGSDDDRNAIIVQRSHHVVFWKNGSPFRVEMHDRAGWEKERFRRDDIDAVFGRALTLEESGYRFRAPCLADHAAIIVAHGTQHAWCLLHWLLDAAALFARPDYVSESKAVADHLRSLGMERQLALALSLVKRLYDVAPPLDIEAAAKWPDRLRGPREYAFRRLVAGGRDSARLSNIIAGNTSYSFPFLRTGKERLASFLELAKVPRRDIEAVSLPRSMFFVHLLLRPWFILSRRWKRLRGKKGQQDE